jgi:hypothetical protein
VANLDGTNPHVIVYGQNNPVGMAVDASHLYWANDPDGTINRANPHGSGPHTIIGGQGRRPPRSEWPSACSAAPGCYVVGFSDTETHMTSARRGRAFAGRR